VPSERILTATNLRTLFSWAVVGGTVCVMLLAASSIVYATWTMPDESQTRKGCDCYPVARWSFMEINFDPSTDDKLGRGVRAIPPQRTAENGD